MKACGRSFSELSKIVKESLNYKSLDAYCERLSKKLFKKINKNKDIYEHSEEKLKFISAITPKGYVFFNNTLFNMSKKVFLIEDSYSVVGSYILKKIRHFALNSAHNVISCPSPFAPSEELNAPFYSRFGYRICS